MACDTSSYGVGAVIAHVMPDGSEKPVAYASRILSKSGKNYAYIVKEALAIIFGIKKFHRYIYGRKLPLITDHKPLTTILSPKASLPALAIQSNVINVIYTTMGDHPFSLLLCN